MVRTPTPVWLVVAALVVTAAPASAQWLNHPTPGLPRLPNGRPNLSAPAPRTAEGRPDVSGLWRPTGGYIVDLAQDLPEAPMQPWAAELFRSRRATLSKDDPTGLRCIPGGVPRANAVPYPFKIVNTPGLVIVLYEAVQSFRQIFTDGRALPVEPSPSWMGYSIGRWEGDALVVESNGFNNEGWLDNDGHPNTEQLRVTERFRRRDVGHMDIEVTIDDPGAYTRPWTVTVPLVLSADDEIIEYICGENNRDVPHLVGK
jgi:hypothetical protein